MKRRCGDTVAVAMPHGKIYHPAKFCELTGSRRPPKYDPDDILESALQYAGHKTGLGYRLWSELIRDFPKVREAYSEDELEEYDVRAKNIYRLLKHRDNKYMAQFALTMKDECEAKMRAYYKRRAQDPNARRPKCTSPVLRQNAGSCRIYGQGFRCRLSDAPNQPLQASPYVVLRFPITPHKHTVEIQLTPYMVEKLATAVSVGAVTINDKTVSIAYEPQPTTPVQAKGMMGMDVNKVQHVTVDTDGNVKRIPNGALEAAQTRRQKHANLGMTGGKPKSKQAQKPKKGRRTLPKHIKHAGRKPKNKRRDERVSRRERARINTRYNNQKKDWLFKLMYRLAALGLEEPTIDRMMKKSNKQMSNETRDLLKMGLSQGTIWAVAKSVYGKHDLPVIGVVAKGTSSTCPTCKKALWEPKYDTKIWEEWRRIKGCEICLYHIDRDDVAAINIVWRGILKYCEPAADSNWWVAGDWEQCVQRLLDATVLWFPQDGEGRRPKGEVMNSLRVGDDLPSLDDHLDVSNCAAGVALPEETPVALY